MSRLAVRTRIMLRALAHRLGSRRAKPANPRRILIAHQLLLGDTLMTTPLVAKLREQHPDAEIAMAMPPAFVPLYAGRPFGVIALPFSLRQPQTVEALLAEPPFDLAFLPGDSRFSWLAQAMGAGWIVGWEGDTPAWKNWLLDDAAALPGAPGALGDLWADLVAGQPPRPYATADWPMPPCKDFERPAMPYAVLHVGASNVKKLWPAAAWHQLADGLAGRGLTVVWSGGKGEEALVGPCDPERRFTSFAGALDLPQMFSLVAGARLLVAPDTGIAHLGKVTGTPTLALFGPGPTFLYDRGQYWAASPFHPLVLDELAPRFQTTLFHRRLPWLPPGPPSNSAATLSVAQVASAAVLAMDRQQGARSTPSGAG